MILLCFGTEHAQQRVLDALGATPSGGCVYIRGCVIQSYWLGNGTSVQETVIDRDPDWDALMRAGFTAIVAVGMPRRPPPHVCEATSASVLEAALGLPPLTPQQTELLRQAIEGDERRRSRRSRRSRAPTAIHYAPVHIHMNVAAPFLALREHSDPLRAGDPECITCNAHRASVCFMPCNHQIMCDECVRKLGAACCCPVCRAPVGGVARPILAPPTV